MSFQSLLIILENLGKNARVVLPAGVVLALLLPSTGDFFKPAVPFILVVLVASAVVRLDIFLVLKAAMVPKRLLRNFFISLFLLVGLPLITVYSARWFGLSEELVPLVTWYAIAPPIATTVWMCVFLGFTAPIVMEVVLLTNIIAPFSGPILGTFLLQEAVPISSSILCFRLAIIIGSGMLIAIFIRYFLGPAFIDRNWKRLDGISACAMLAFLVPAFDGVGGIALMAPIMALSCLALAMALNFGTQLFVIFFGHIFSVIKRGGVPAGTKSIAVAAGNRNLGLYFAALPSDPFLTLFVAAYQAPLYMTPLVAGWFSNLKKRYSK